MAAGYLLGVTLVTAAVMIAWLMLREIRLYFRRAESVSGRQVIIRMMVGMMLLGLILRVLLGTYLYLDPGAHGIRPTVTYWSKNMALGYFIAVIAMIDLGLVLRYNRRRRLWQESHADRLFREYPQLRQRLGNPPLDRGE
jgi:hypothetical protein